MGTDKSQLFFKGEKLVTKMIRLSQKVSDDVFIAGAQSHQKSPCYPDESPDKGPLSGIRTALSQAKYDWVLILACDMLFFNESIVNWLTNEFNSLSKEKIVFAANERNHYLIGFYHRSVLVDVKKALHSDDLSVGQLLMDGNFRKLNIPKSLESFIANINSPKDLDTFGFMKVKIIAFGQIEEILGKKELEWMTESSDLNEFKNELFEAFPELNTISFRFALNESLVDNANLSMNDTIALLPPFAGG
ncbi:Molybdenum cofactor guanylyltransferase [Parvicella tangerina]|uniref:Molybdenum cofactor guanylyltransferase n=2 Tax=Parvicella tangerina TaxID=2829795 RepID=A0A916JKB2_9FLAO|nr:Molybdenum cofactor guanylyltransferase [Parvicella tangerina]